MKQRDREFKKVLCPNGFVSPKGRETGNGLFYTAEALLVIEDIPMRMEILRQVWKCYTKWGVRRAWKTWQKNQHQAPDDYIGIGLIADELDPNLAKRVLEMARENWGMLNEQDGTWRWKSLLWRMPQVVAHLQFAAGEKPGPFRTIAWCGSIIWSMFKRRKSQDTHAKAFAMCKVAENRSKYLDVLISVWRWRFKKRFTGIGQVRLEYGWPKDHPTVKYMWHEI